jgi:hypothetical protein
LAVKDLEEAEKVMAEKVMVEKATVEKATVAVEKTEDVKWMHMEI